MKVENFLVAGAETGARIGDQLGELGLHHRVRHVDVDCFVKPGIGLGLGAGSAANPPPALIAGDAEKPWSEPRRVAQLMKLLRGAEEGVLERVGRVVVAAQDRAAEVVDRVGVALVDIAERLLVAPKESRDKRGVISH